MKRDLLSKSSLRLLNLILSLEYFWKVYDEPFCETGFIFVLAGFLQNFPKVIGSFQHSKTRTLNFWKVGEVVQLPEYF